MRTCPRCGVPRILTSEHRWLPNGTITLARDETHRMVFIDNDALNYTMASIGERLGVPLEAIIQEAKRKSGKHFMDAVLSGAKGVIARNLISTRVYDQLSKQVSMLGLGSPEVSSYKRHRYLDGVIRDAYSGPAITGDICGAFESVEGCAASASFEVADGGTVRCHIEAGASARPEGNDRASYAPPPMMGGRNIYELCPVCKAPLSMGRQYAFEVDRGIIEDRRTGHRVVLISVMTLTNLFGELTAELGDDVPRMMADIEKARVRELISSKGKDLDTSEAGYLKYMKTLELKGMGNGSAVSVSDGTIRARVDNPYYEPLIAGFLAGFYEATTGREASLAWTEGTSGYSEVTIQPAV
ncbi:MAG TPA: hypothetical protein VIK15_06110 [Candidatus Anoxymicrobiaceae bacterium]